jgi:DNA-binding NtrC family response regulator
MEDTRVSASVVAASPAAVSRRSVRAQADWEIPHCIDTPALTEFLCPRALEIRSRTCGGDRPLAMVGQSPVFVAMLERIAKVARYRESVLITGESGSGKEHVARAISLLEPRQGLPFVSVSCPQYQEGNLTVSELFGHVKGSFTGAVADHAGAFAQAHTGTLFLDEIADLPSSAQAMLLRTLATGEYKPVGASEGRRVDVRVVAATNRPLNEMMASGAFRHDLFFRLRHFHITVPPLRDRGDDWRLIAEFYLLQLSERYRVRKRLSSEAERYLASCPWPGNVRQLTAVVGAGFALADSTLIGVDDIASQLEGYDGHGHGAHREPPPRVTTMPCPAPPVADVEAAPGSFWDTVHRAFIERDLNRSQVRAFIARGLEAAHGSYRDLLGVLGLPTADYQRFMDFLRHHDLKPDRSDPADAPEHVRETSFPAI